MRVGNFCPDIQTEWPFCFHFNKTCELVLSIFSTLKWIKSWQCVGDESYQVISTCKVVNMSVCWNQLFLVFWYTYKHPTWMHHLTRLNNENNTCHLCDLNQWHCATHKENTCVPTASLTIQNNKPVLHGLLWLNPKGEGTVLHCRHSKEFTKASSLPVYY